MKKKVFYRYNPSTLTYDRVFPSTQERVLLIIKHLSLSLFIGIGVFAITTYFFDSPKEKELVKENRLLHTQYRVLSKRMDEVLFTLTDLQQRDDYMYRALFHAEPIPFSIRNAGNAGTNKYEYLEKINNPELIIQTSKKMDKIAKQIYLQSNSFDEVVDMLKNQTDRLKHTPSILPVPKKFLRRMASGYGPRLHPIHKIIMMHNGMDFSAETGTPIYATADGIVDVAGWLQGFGKCVKIDHGYGYGTTYAHMDDIHVTAGQVVTRGQQIGEVGDTGQSVGSHLHYEVRRRGQAINPSNFYYEDLNSEEYDEILRLAASKGQTMD